MPHPDGLSGVVLQPEPGARLGWISDWALARGVGLVVCRPADFRSVNLRSVRFVVALGSNASVYDRSIPWIDDEMQVLRHAVDSAIPVLGICFGAQMLAHVLGGEVAPSDSPEVGWYSIDSPRPELVPTGLWLEWHFDAFTNPPDATELARSPAGVQAFVYGSSLGVQFHPEATSQLLQSWIRAQQHQPDPRVTHTGVDLVSIESDMTARTREQGELAYRLFDGFFEAAALVPTGKQSDGLTRRQLLAQCPPNASSALSPVDALAVPPAA